PREQQVVGQLAAGPGAVDEESELLLRPLLAHELVQRPGTQGGVELPLLVADGRPHDPFRVGHLPTALSASRSSSSTERSPLPASDDMASLASCGESPSDRSASRTSESGPVGAPSPSPDPSLSLRSTTTRPAIFFPTPGTVASAATSAAATALRSASG